MAQAFSQDILSEWQRRAAQARDLPTDYSFHPAYGYSLDALLEVEPVQAPEDFAGFWQETHAETLEVDPQESVREVACGYEGWRCFEIEYSSWRGFRVGGWLMLPADGVITSAAVQGHGYGGRTDAPPGLLPGMAVLYPAARGFTRSARTGLPGVSAEHVLYGIESREDYLIRGCVADLWAAATVMQLRFPDVPLFFMGGSFGGGLGALAVPWEKRFSRAVLGYPTFGQHPIRVTIPCVGSGEA